MTQEITRRGWLAGSSAAVAAALVAAPGAQADEAPPARDGDSAAADWQYCLNTSTIRGQELSLVEQIEITAEAGYDGIEPWLRDIAKFADQGGNLEDLGKRIADAGLTVASAIGFANWIVDDDANRAAGLETARRDMDLVRRIGGCRIAAPPVGATNQEGLDLFAAAERYARLLEVGREAGVTPQLELWGFSKSLSRLGELMFVAVESGQSDACLLPDVYHIYKGGSDFAGLRLISGPSIHVFHVNDYPADPPRQTIGDADRVFPGDGVAPLDEIFRDLNHIGFAGTLSLELFNREYWKQDPRMVARTGLEKMRAAVKHAFAGETSTVRASRPGSGES